MNLLNSKLGRGIPLAVVVAASLTLFGCGGEGNAGSDGSSIGGTDTQSATLSAQDAIYSTNYTDSFEVDLSSKVVSSTDDGFVLYDVELLSNDDNCRVESMTDTGFVIQASDTKVCDYRYYVSPKTISPMTSVAEAAVDSSSQGSSWAVARVAVSGDPSETELIPVSETTFMDETVTVVLKTKLNDVGFTLGEEFVLTDVNLPYGRASSAVIDPVDAQAIIYTPPAGFTGIDRVLYTLEDSANGLVLMGVLDIAVGNEANKGFTIEENPVYPEWVDVTVITDIDISDYVISEDGDDYQVVYVNVFDAFAFPKDSTDVTNKRITFISAEPGDYDISYAVSDHNGTYDMGSLRVRVLDQINVWEEIYNNGSTFSSPFTLADVREIGAHYLGTETNNDAPYTLALMTEDQAIEACNLIGGAVPATASLQDGGFLAEVVDKDWPKGRVYMSNTGEGVNVSNGNSVSSVLSGYVTCEFVAGAEDFQIISSSPPVLANDSEEFGIEVQVFDADGVGLADVPVGAVSSSRNAYLVDPIVYTDAQGKANFYLKSQVAETVAVTIEYKDTTKSVQAEFLADMATAAITLDSTTIGNTYVEGDNVLISAFVKDDFSNPITTGTVTHSANELVFDSNEASLNEMGYSENLAHYAGSTITEPTETPFSVQIANGDSDSGVLTWVPLEVIDLTSSEQWSSKSRPRYGEDSPGDHRFTPDGLEITSPYEYFYTVYEKAYVDNNFLLKASISSMSTSSHGSVNIYLQQRHDGSDIGSVPFINDVGATIEHDGGTGISLSYYQDDAVNVYQQGEQVGNTFNGPPISVAFTYLWFEKTGNEIAIYFDTVDVKPLVPFARVSAQFGNAEPYWLTISSITQTDSSARYMTDMRVSSY